MVDKAKSWEFDLGSEGHTFENEGLTAVELGEGKLRYRVEGLDWGNLPEGWTYKEATAVAVDSKDRVFVFNRGTCPMIVFDQSGEIVDTWGEGVFRILMELLQVQMMRFFVLTMVTVLSGSLHLTEDYS